MAVDHFDLKLTSSIFIRSFTATRILESCLQFFFEQQSTEQRNLGVKLDSNILPLCHGALDLVKSLHFSQGKTDDWKRLPTIGGPLFAKMEKRE